MALKEVEEKRIVLTKEATQAAFHCLNNTHPVKKTPLKKHAACRKALMSQCTFPHPEKDNMGQPVIDENGEPNMLQIPRSGKLVLETEWLEYLEEAVEEMIDKGVPSLKGIPGHLSDGYVDLMESIEKAEIVKTNEVKQEAQEKVA